MGNMVFNLKKRIITNTNRPYFRIFHLSLSQNPFLSRWRDVCQPCDGVRFAACWCGLLQTSRSKHDGRWVQVTCWERKWHVIWCSLSLFPVFVFLFLSRGEDFFFQDFAGAGSGSFIWTNQLACCYIIASILPLPRFYPRCNRDAYTRSYRVYHTLNSLLIYKINETISPP